MFVRCPDLRRSPYDVVGCGHEFEAHPDNEVRLCCPKCGLWFMAEMGPRFRRNPDIDSLEILKTYVPADEPHHVAALQRAIDRLKALEPERGPTANDDPPGYMAWTITIGDPDTDDSEAITVYIANSFESHTFLARLINLAGESKDVEAYGEVVSEIGRLGPRGERLS